MNLSSTLRNHFWIAPSVLIASAAALNAQGMMALVGAALAPDEAALARAPRGSPPAQTADTSTRSVSADAILSRNPFDSHAGSLLGSLLPAVDHDDGDPMNAPPCEGFRAPIVVASPDPAWSFAAFSPPGESKTFLRRRGDEIAGKTVEYIAWDRVWLTRDSHRCQVEVYKPAAAESPAKPTVANPVVGRSAVPQDIAKGIARVGPNEFNIDRGIVDKILENQAALMSETRIAPALENGKPTGIRLMNLKPDSLLTMLGMQEGDRIQSINGFDLTNPEKALEAYARLRTADRLTVQLQRGGAGINVDYNIR